MGTNDPLPVLNDDTDVWRQIAELIVRGQARTEARLDHLGTDVAELKTQMTETREQLGRLERATERRFDRLGTDVAELKTQMTGTREQVGRLETQMTGTRDQVGR